MNGLLLIDKPAGITSHDVVDRVRRELKIKKAGHAGTLDPQATGLLVLALGSATRWLPYLPGDKRYLAALKLGIETDTEDIWGKELKRTDASGISGDAIRAALESLKESKEQVPPMVSALKHQGKPLYAYAREGVEIERAARPLEIFELKVLAVRGDEADFEVHCGSGTYVRTLCSQAGKALGSGGCMAALRRTSSGLFKVEDAISLENLGQAAERILGPSQALAHLKEYRVSEAAEAGLAQGRDLPLDGDDYDTSETWRLTGRGGELLGLAQAVGEPGSWRLHPKRVFSKA